MIRGATAADPAALESAELELLRNEVRDLKSQLRTLLDDHRAAREAAAPAPPPPPPDADRKCLEGSLGVATLLVARCLVRRRQQRRQICACPFATCATAAAAAASCFAGPAELVRDVRA